MKSTKCPNCGLVSWSVGNNCKSCGADLTQRVFTPPDNAYAPNYQSNHQSWDESDGASKGLAVFSLVLGVISFLTFGLLGVGAVAGSIVAAVALRRVSRDPRKYGGRGLAIAGLVLNVTSLVMVVPIGIIAAIAIPNLLAARNAANEGSAISTMRRISEAESIYLDSHGQYGTLPDLAKAGLIDAVVASGNKSGYKFVVQFEPDDPSHSTSYHAYGEPVVYRNTGRRTFYVNETNVIRVRDNFGQDYGEGKFYPPLNSDYPPQRMQTADELQRRTRSYRVP
jgi:type IV pilus assembly protein PilA